MEEDDDDDDEDDDDEGDMAEGKVDQQFRMELMKVLHGQNALVGFRAWSSCGLGDLPGT